MADVPDRLEQNPVSQVRFLPSCHLIGFYRTLRRLLSKPCVPDRRNKIAAIVERLTSLGKDCE